MQVSKEQTDNLLFVSNGNNAAMLFIECTIKDIHEGLNEFMGCVLTHATEINICHGDFFDVTASAFKAIRSTIETFYTYWKEEEGITLTLLCTFCENKILYRFIAPPEFPVKELEQEII